MNRGGALVGVLLAASCCVMVESVALGIYTMMDRQSTIDEITAIGEAMQSAVEEKLDRTFSQYEVQSYDTFLQDDQMLAIHVKVADKPDKEFISFVVSDAYNQESRTLVTAIDGLSKSAKNNLSVMLVGKK